MIIKVCGIKTLKNINEISPDIDMIGLNFYKPSARYVDQEPSAYSTLHENVKKVGVFVNENIKIIEHTINEYGLDYVQLHGDETYTFGIEVARLTKVIKVFRISEPRDFESINKHDYQTLNLLDYRSAAYGGAGQKFDWKMLSYYKSKLPFLLSGGIGPKDVEAIRTISHPKLIGLDINSKFESSTGNKDMELVAEFVNNLKTASLN